MRASRTPHVAGFTLIEVVVATVILASALVAALATYGAELRALSRAREVLIAVELAEDRLTAIELTAADRLPNLPDSLAEGSFAEPFSEYSWQADATQVSGHALAEVTVSVVGPTGSHSLTAVLALPDLRRVAP